MKVKYIKDKNLIEIKDGLKNQFLLLNLLMILNLLNAMIRLIRQKVSEYGTIEYFWIAIGVVSIFFLYFFLFRKSTAEKIKISKINRIKEKSVFGNKRISLELKNGKNRDIGNFKDENEFVQVLELFKKMDIPK